MVKSMNISELKNWSKDKKKIAIFCAGQVGIAIYRILQKCGVRVDCFFDNDAQKHGTEIVDGCCCEDADEVAEKENYLIFIGILERYYDAVEADVRKKGFANIADFTELFDDIVVHYTDLYKKLVIWFQEYPLLEVFCVRQPNRNSDAAAGRILKSRRTAVYTSIFGQYDSICMPQAEAGRMDYYFISDEKKQDIDGYIWIDAKKVIPETITSPIKRNRYVKMHPHLLFPEYDYSIYVDGNIEIKQDISSFIRESRSGISVFMHPRRDCIFYEAVTIVNFKRVPADDVNKQMERYIKEGMPLHYGLPEMPVIAREHNKPACRKIMDEWWNEFDRGAQRDQLSFMYVMWKNGMGLDDLSSLGSDFRKSEHLEVKAHQMLSCGIRNEKDSLKDG